MDQRMPEIDGEEAFRIIKSHKDCPNIGTPVICLTADAVVGARERYLSKGFNDYLTKPIDSTYLEMMLKKYIPKEKIKSASDEVIAVPVIDVKSTEEKKDPSFKILEDAGIDTSKGIANCGGGEDFYLSILTDYLNSSDEKKMDLNSFLDDGDLKNYEILIHSLKSTSAMIGADMPSKTAQALETAARNGDKEFISANHGNFMNEYDLVLNAIRKVVTSDEDPGEYTIADNGAMEFGPEE